MDDVTGVLEKLVEVVENQSKAIQQLTDKVKQIEEIVDALLEDTGPTGQ